MRLEVVDTVPASPRELAKYSRDVRSRLMRGPVRLTPPPPPIQVTPEPATRLNGSHEVKDAGTGLGWSFGQFYAATAATFSLDDSLISVHFVARTVAGFYGLTLNNLQSGCKLSRFAHARQVAMYLACEMTRKSYPAIGRVLGGRDHSTIRYGHLKIQRLIQTDERLADEIDVLKLRISDGVAA
jgi:hypothetical protein